MVLQCDEEPVDMPPEELRHLIFQSIKNKRDEVFLLKDLVGSDGIRDEDVIHTMRDPDIDKVDGLTGQETTYRELHDKATSIAMFLNKIDVEPGVVVGILSDVMIEANYFLTGVWLSGGILCTMNPNLKKEEIRQLLDICGAKVVYCQLKYLNSLEEALALDGQSTEVTVITDGPSASCIDINDIMNGDSSGFEVGEYDANETISHILFTSGTTGVPKGVMISSLSAKYTAYRLQEVQAPFMCTSPLYWISYIAIIVWILTRGKKMIIPRTKYLPGTQEPDPRHLLDCIQKYKPWNWFTSPSVALDLCECAEGYDLSSLALVGVGGSNILPSQRKKICDALFGGRRILFNLYGSTEVGVITRWPSGEMPEHDSPKAASVGVINCGVQLKVVDPVTGSELGAGELGEFVVKSKAIMKGYINKELPERYTENDWYHMGDIGWYDEEGYIYFSSRLKEIMKYRGLQIAPAEIEKIIVQHPGVKEVCVVGRPHPVDGERPAAFVVRESDDVTEQEIVDFVTERVIEEKKLRGGVFFIEEIPKSGVGKTLRRELVKLFDQMEEATD